MKKIYQLAVLIVVMGGAAAPVMFSGQAQIETGTDTGAQVVRLAVPVFPLRPGADAAAEMAAVFNETLWNDLDFSGVVQLVSRSFYPLGSFSRPIDISPAAWTSPTVDAQFVSFGNVSLVANRFVVEAHLWDLKGPIADREALGLRFTGELNEASVRLIAHQFADRIVQVLGGGIRGVNQTKIAFVSNRAAVGEKEIWVMDYDGYNQYQLTTVRSLALTPSWAPDGERIAFTSWRLNSPDVAIISALDRRGSPFPEFEGTTTTPTWSPDGGRIAFASSMQRVRNVPDMEIFVADARGENLRRLTNSVGVDISPVWNPSTGREIAFVSERSGTPQIYIIDVDGGNLRRIVQEGGTAANPAWSPDGQTIAFAWQRSGTSNFNIYLHSLSTGRNVQLTANARDNERPSWSPDGRHLVFQSNRDGVTQVYSMLADGTKVRRLTSQGQNEGPSWSGYMGQ